MLDNVRNSVLSGEVLLLPCIMIERRSCGRGKEVGEGVAHKGEVTKNKEVRT